MIQSPQRFLLHCYEVLAAVHDAARPAVQQQAWQRLQAQAAAISDEGLRTSFLTNVPFNQALCRLIVQPEIQSVVAEPALGG